MPPVKYPHPFEDLVELAKPVTYDPQRSFKDQLRAIDVLRGQSQDSREEGDLENAYIYLGRAAAVINEHLAHHSQYNMLTAKQQTDLANNGRLMVRTLQELEPQLKERYQAYQEGIANGTIPPPPPRRRRAGDERDKRKPADRPPDPAPVTMPRTPTSIEDHTTRSTKPAPGVTVMLSEAQERERRQHERDRRAEADRLAQSHTSRPMPESAIPTPVPTPERRETSTLTISQPPSSTHVNRLREVGGRLRSDVEMSDADMRAAMYRLQEEYDARLKACLEDTLPMTETERMQRALDIIADTGQKERKWIEDKSRMALAQGRPTTFDKELNDQIAVHEQRLKAIRQIFARRNEEASRRRQADPSARADAEERQRARRLQTEFGPRRRETEAEIARDRYRPDREYSDAERSSRSREDQLLHDREISAAQDAMARVLLAKRHRDEAEAEAEYNDRQRKAAEGVQTTIQRGQAERVQREIAGSRLEPSGQVASRSSRSYSPVPPSSEYTTSHQPSPSFIPPYIPPLPRPQPEEPSPAIIPSFIPQHTPQILRPNQPPPSASPNPPHIPMRRPQQSRLETNPALSALPQTSQPQTQRGRSPVPYPPSSSPPMRVSQERDRDHLDNSIPILHNTYNNYRSNSYPQEKLAAIAALPIESPTRSFHGSLSEDFRDVNGKPFPITTTTSPPPTELLPIAGQSPNYPALMTRHQKSQGYVPSRGSMFAGPAEEPDGGTPNGLLFQPNGVTQVPQQPPDPYSMYGPKRPGSLNRSSTGSGPFPRLRQVCLPAETLQRFVALAALNTAKKKETLGMLYGRSNAAGGFDVTTLLIPKQTSTENTCNMTSEELIVEFQQSRNVVGLGWIHTHPTQSCFMSSMDLHTQAGFQRSLPEAIAIVCAPRHQPNFGIFRLTDPPGLPVILKCENKAAFHPHLDNVPIYTDADSDHVVMIRDSFIEIVDLR